MSIGEFLKTLDYDQLLYAKEAVDKLIIQKKNEPKIKLWVIYDEIFELKVFKHEDYHKAVEFYQQVLEEHINKKPFTEIEMTLNQITLRESEALEKLNKSNKS